MAPEPLPVTHRLYAVIRDDLGMNAGKIASQAGHAFLDAYLLALASDPARCAAYRAIRHGTKVVLAADHARILHLHARAQLLGLPSALIIDEGCSNFFEGKPTLTAFGIGPLTRREAGKLLGGIPLLSSQDNSTNQTTNTTNKNNI